MLQNVLENQINLVHYYYREDCLSIYRELIRQKTGNILIVAAEYHDVREIAQFLAAGLDSENKHTRLLVFEKELTPAQWQWLVTELNQSCQRAVVIGAKKMIFLPMPFFKWVIIDQEEQKAHYQYDSNPRYHVREVSIKLHEIYQKNFTLVFTSLAPSLQLMVQQQVHQIEPSGQWYSNHLTIVDMEEEKRKNNFSWFSDELVTQLRTVRHAFLFLNRTGEYKIALCKNCARLLAPNISRCSQCGSSDLQLRGKGVGQLAKELIKLFPNKKIVKIEERRSKNEKHSLSQKIATADIVIGTEKILRLTSLTSFDFIGIMSVDHLLVYPHWQSHERVWQLLIKIFSARVPTILQTHAPHHPVIRAALPNNYNAFYTQEHVIRKKLNLPPTQKYFILRDNQTKQSKVVVGELAVSQLAPQINIERY